MLTWQLVSAYVFDDAAAGGAGLVLLEPFQDLALTIRMRTRQNDNFCANGKIILANLEK